MGLPEQVVQWLDKNFPKPRIDPEWLEGCTQWLEDEQNLSPITDFPEFVERVKGQLLESDLVDSMLHGTGLDPHVSGTTGPLRGPPVLVQIIAMTEIGTSAFNLEQVRAAREERILAGVGDVEGEEDGDVEVEGEGPMPKYPRGHLRFRLTDGATILEAFEYRPMPQFVIGTTPLGFKMHLKGTRIQNGMVMLEPATVTLLGGRQADLEAKQLEDFKRDLRVRLGRPFSPGPAEAQAPVPAADTVPIAVRSPLRDISPPPVPLFPQHDDDVDMEPRRRLPGKSSLNTVSEPSGSKEKKKDRPVIGLPSRHTRTSAGGVGDKSEEGQGDRNMSVAERATLVFAGSQPNQSMKSSYFDRSATVSGSGSSRRVDGEINTVVENLDFNLEPTGGQLRRTFPTPPVRSPEPPVGDFDFDFLDEMDQENHTPPAAVNKGKGRADAPFDNSSLNPPPTAPTVDEAGFSDYGMDDETDFDDPAFLEHINKIEKAALEGAHPPSSGSVSGSGGSSSIPSSHVLSDKSRGTTSSVPAKSPHPSTIPRPSTQVPSREIIEIDDSDDEMLEADDKENAPVATRHIRRRTEDGGNTFGTSSRTSTFSSQIRSKPPMSQKTGLPVVLAARPSDILDLSDSD